MDNIKKIINEVQKALIKQIFNTNAINSTIYDTFMLNDDVIDYIIHTNTIYCIRKQNQSKIQIKK